MKKSKGLGGGADFADSAAVVCKSKRDANENKEKEGFSFKTQKEVS